MCWGSITGVAEEFVSLGTAVAGHASLLDMVIISDPDYGVDRRGLVALVSMPRLSPGSVLTARWVAQGDQFNARYGRALAVADVNNDGRPDLLVGQPHYSGKLLGAGRVLLYLGQVGGGFSDTADQVVDGPVDSAQHGWAIAAAGDLNKDGNEDVVVGAPGKGPGAVAVYYGGNTPGAYLQHVQTFTGDQEGERFGFSLAAGRDVNGDGVCGFLPSFLHTIKGHGMQADVAGGAWRAPCSCRIWSSERRGTRARSSSRAARWSSRRSSSATSRSP
jgi:hypothetical protein